MNAFVIAGIVILFSLVVAFLMVFADGMRAVPTGDTTAAVTLIVGICIAAAIIVMHFLGVG